MASPGAPGLPAPLVFVVDRVTNARLEQNPKR